MPGAWWSRPPTDPRRAARALGRAGACAARGWGRAAACVGALLACAAALGADPPASASGLDLTAIDRSVRVQDDLFGHANGAWLARAVIPPDQVYAGAVQSLRDATQGRLRVLIAHATRERQDARDERIADLYASFMDAARVQSLGLRPLAEELALVDAVRDLQALSAALPRLDRVGVGVPLSTAIAPDDRDASVYAVALVQSGLGLPNRDYYLDLQDARLRAARAAYLRFMATLLERGGADEVQAAAQANAVLALETDLARVQWSEVQNRDPVKAYTRIALDALGALAPGLDWPAYLDSAGLTGRVSSVLVRQPSYLRGLGELVQRVPLSTWKSYLRVHWLSEFAPYLSQDFVDARFAFDSAVQTGVSADLPRGERAITLVDQLIGDDLGARYVARYFSGEDRERVERLVRLLMQACRDSLATLDWMGQATKQRALAKLAKLHAKIGFPVRWIDYTALQIRRDDLVGNVLRARRFEDARQLAKLGRRVDRDEWGITPQTVNAYYDQSLNEIVLPAAYLQPPNFNPDADDAVNFGAVGAVIGHEISHGFDDEGSQYDADGNLAQWWGPEDRERFEVKTRALVAQYAADEALPGYRVDGALTLGENIADVAGLSLSYRAWRLTLGERAAPVIDGFSGDERFFYAWAQVWRGKMRAPALLAQLKSDPHAPDEVRVNGAARNLGAFYTTFGVRPGDRLYLPPRERVQLW